MNSNREPLAVESLVSEEARRETEPLDVAVKAKRPISVQDHERFRESITDRPAPAGDEIDELVEELRTVTKP